MEFTGSALARLWNTYTGETWYVILTDSSTFGTDPTMLDVIQQELIQSDSYTRQPYVLGSATFDTVQSRAEFPTVDVLLTNPPTGVTISYDRVVLLSGASATANVPVDSVDATANTITFASDPGLSNGDKVILTPGMGGVVPPELLNSGSPTILYVVNDTGTTIQLALTSGGSPIDFSAATLPIDCRFANGYVEAIENTGSLQLLPGNSRTYRIALNLGTSTADVVAA